MDYFRQSQNRGRRFARCMNRVVSGVLGRDSSKFYRLVLTTREGTANDWATINKDLKKMVQQLRYKGIKVEYVLLPHVTDKKQLLHLDGVMWLRGGNVSLFEIQVMWVNLHGATEVKFSPLARIGALAKYVVSHMFKDYDKIVGFKGRLLISKGWMPKGWQEVDKLLTRMALDRISRMGKGVWDIKRDMYRRWLCYENITVLVEGFGMKRQRQEEIE